MEEHPDREAQHKDRGDTGQLGDEDHLATPHGDVTDGEGGDEASNDDESSRDSSQSVTVSSGTQHLLQLGLESADVAHGASEEHEDDEEGNIGDELSDGAKEWSPLGQLGSCSTGGGRGGGQR